MAISYFGYGSTPSDNGSYNTSPIAIAPPSNMQAGDLVFVTVCFSGTSGTLSVVTSGNQTWTALTQRNATRNRTRSFWCVFNGTWDANPAWTGSGTANVIARMLVFRPDGGTASTWAIDVAESSNTYTAPSSPYTVTITGITTQTPNALVIAGWTSADDNQWGSLTSGWTYPSALQQVRNTYGTYQQSQTHAYKVQADAGSSGNPAQNQTVNGGDAGTRIVIAFKEIKSPTTVPDPFAVTAATLGTVEYGSAVEVPSIIEAIGEQPAPQINTGNTLEVGPIAGTFSPLEAAMSGPRTAAADPIESLAGQVEPTVAAGAVRVEAVQIATGTQPVQTPSGTGVIAPDAIAGTSSQPTPTLNVGNFPDATATPDSLTGQFSVADAPAASIEARHVASENTAQASAVAPGYVGPTTGAVTVTPEPVDAAIDQPDLGIIGRALVAIQAAIQGLWQTLAPVLAGTLLYVAEPVLCAADQPPPAVQAGCVVMPNTVDAQAEMLGVTMAGAVIVVPTPIPGTFGAANAPAVDIEARAVVAEVAALGSLISPSVELGGEVIVPILETVDAQASQPTPETTLVTVFSPEPIDGAFDCPANDYRIWHVEAATPIAGSFEAVEPEIHPQNKVVGFEWAIPGYYEMPTPTIHTDWTLTPEPIYGRLRQSQNLLTDGGLENWLSATNLTSWGELIAGASTVNRDSANAIAGTYSARMDIDASNNYGEIYQGFSGSVAFSYLATFNYKTESGKTIGPFFRVTISGTNYYAQPDGSWKKSNDPGFQYHYAELTSTAVAFHEWTATLPAGATAPLWGVYNVAAASSSFWVDNCFVGLAYAATTGAAVVAPDAIAVEGSMPEPSAGTEGNIIVHPDEISLGGTLPVIVTNAEALVALEPVDAISELLDPSITTELVTTVPVNHLAGAASLAGPSITADGLAVVDPIDAAGAQATPVLKGAALIAPNLIDVASELTEPSVATAGNIIVHPAIIMGALSPADEAAIVVDAIIVPAEIYGAFDQPEPMVWNEPVTVEVEPIDAELSQPTPAVGSTINWTFTPDPITGLFSAAAAPSASIAPTAIPEELYAQGSLLATGFGAGAQIVPAPVTATASQVAPLVNATVISVTISPQPITGTYSPSFANDTSADAELVPYEIDGAASQPTPTPHVTNSPTAAVEPITGTFSQPNPIVLAGGGILITPEPIDGTFSITAVTLGEEKTVEVEPVEAEASTLAPNVAIGDVVSVTTAPSPVTGTFDQPTPTPSGTISLTVIPAYIEGAASVAEPTVALPTIVAVYLPNEAEASVVAPSILINSSLIVPAPVDALASPQAPFIIAVQIAISRPLVKDTFREDRVIDSDARERVADVPGRERIVDIYLGRK